MTRNTVTSFCSALRKRLISSLALFTILSITLALYDVMRPCPVSRITVRDVKIVSVYESHITCLNSLADQDKNLRHSFQHLPVLNHFNFSYLINVEDACDVMRAESRGHQEKEEGKKKGQVPVKVFFAVPSAAGNFQRRMATRNGSQGAYARKFPERTRTLFFVGVPTEPKGSVAGKKNAKDDTIQAKLVEESRKYGDIVQVDVKDAYRKLVDKVIAIFQWVSKFCPKAEFVVKFDDDVTFINVAKAVAALDRKKRVCREFVIGKLRRDSQPIRHAWNKWFLSEEEYPSDVFPPFVTGGAVGYPTSSAILLYQQALRTKLVWLEDVFLTGVCRHQLGIPVLEDKDFWYSHGNGKD